MDDQTKGTDDEFAAMQAVYMALAPLEVDARVRVVDYIISRLEIATTARKGPPAEESVLNGGDEADGTNGQTGKLAGFGSFAELHDAAQPKTNAERALVAGYWIQVCQGSETFDGQSANNELKNLGHGLPNVTHALTSLKNQKPALVLQLKKSGSSQQSRKTYKVTVAGIKTVENMINE